MAYGLDEIRQSQQIFYYLLQFHALAEDTETMLFRVYSEQERVRTLVKSQAEQAQCQVERYGDVIYLIPDVDNDFLGYSKKQLKARLCKSGATDRDYYLSQFVIITLLVTFYDGQGSSSKVRNYIRVGELMNLLSQRLADGVQRAQEQNTDGNVDGVAYVDMQQAFEALRSDDRGSRKQTTKEGFLYHILRFLEEQGLIQFIEADETVYTTSKLDRFMDWNLLNKNHYDRVLQVLKVVAGNE